ncbi:sterile alpha motif domain-containing protein 1-like isoform X2 [Salvelinus alpinus]|uniref:sterile alpha motif domain-containing protein 1-like isoform X2 n=1 Tax=Salvelinus alpinus TaxID=8036 RepID=UPI0039FC68DE
MWPTQAHIEASVLHSPLCRARSLLALGRYRRAFYSVTSETTREKRRTRPNPNSTAGKTTTKMSESKYRDWILETIDSLRSRKARPDLERICRMVRRRHGSDPDRTREELEKLIQEQTVLKVSYKGSISYRNAAKVQRKSRKKSDFTPDNGGGSEVEGEKAIHSSLNNNGDSAHSFTDLEEVESRDREEDSVSEPSEYPDPRPETPGLTSEKKQKLFPLNSGNGPGCCPGCGETGCAETGCAAGRGCSGKASASKDKRLGERGGGGGQEGGGSSPLAGNHETKPGQDGSGAPSKAKGVCGGAGGVETAGQEGSSSCVGVAAETEHKICQGSASSCSSSNSHLMRPKQLQPASPLVKPKLRAGRCEGNPWVGGSGQTSSDLGERLIASVRRLAEQNRASALRGETRGGHKPLGLKEILGYLTSQDGLSSEGKLTRNRVKVVLEREVARGRLRRTRCGNITLPVRGVEAAPAKPTGPANRLLKSALQDKHIGKKEVKEEEPMETESGEEEEDEEEKGTGDAEDGGQSDTQASGGEEGSKGVTCPAPVPMETEPRNGDDIAGGSEGQAGVKQEDKQPEHTTNTVSPDQIHTTNTVSPDQIHTTTQDQNVVQSERESHTSSVHNHNCSAYKTEVGVSSCLLTPTASPRDSGLAEERGMNGGVFVKSELGSLNPVNWTVSDVVSYFTSAGFPEQALAFRTQEIDGKSLLLMQRNDVLTGLSIRLGPALKIYERHVKVLQRTHFEEDD